MEKKFYCTGIQGLTNIGGLGIQSGVLRRYSPGFFPLLQLRGPRDLVCVCVWHLYHRVSVCCCCIYTTCRQHLTTMATEFIGCASEWGLTASIPKTKAMAVNGSQLTSDVVLSSGASVEMVTKFRYIGGLVSGDGALDREISSRISKASPAFGFLQGSIFQCRALSIAVKQGVVKTPCSKATRLSILCVVHLAVRIRKAVCEAVSSSSFGCVSSVMCLLHLGSISYYAVA